MLATAPVQTSRDGRTAVDKALSLLLSFGLEGCDGLGVSELARRADMSKSTAFRLLGMLQRNGVVERIGSSYRLGVSCTTWDSRSIRRSMAGSGISRRRS